MQLSRFIYFSKKGFSFQRLISIFFCYSRFLLLGILVHPQSELVLGDKQTLSDPYGGKILPVKKCIGVGTGNAENLRNLFGAKSNGELVKRCNGRDGYVSPFRFLILLDVQWEWVWRYRFCLAAVFLFLTAAEQASQYFARLDAG